LAAAAGAAAATVVSAVAGPLPALAAGDTGKVIHVGDEYDDVRSTTILFNKFNSKAVLRATNAYAGNGVQGESDDGFGITGVSGGTGVLGYSGPPSPFPAARPFTGVLGIGAWADGRGGVFAGEAAPLKLRPSSAASHPVQGQMGDLFVDKHGRLWFCKGGTTWKQLA
jgi:hypothetical protein